MKICFKCKQSRDTSSHKNYCKSCWNEYKREHYRTHPNDRIIMYKSHLKNTYGITLEELERLYLKAGKQCQICDEPLTMRQLHIDHDHATGKVRGILCKPCNVGLGMFKDNSLNLSKAIRYLKPTVSSYSSRAIFFQS